MRSVSVRSIFWYVLTAMLSTFCSFADAQQPTRIPRIGYLSGNSPSSESARTAAFRQGLRELGYIEGKNIIIEQRWGEGKMDRLPALVAELMRLNVQVIVTAGVGGKCPPHQTKRPVALFQ